MLILGRRANQSIVFPNCGITVRILDVNGRVAKIGIEAPRSVDIMRGELVMSSRAKHSLIPSSDLNCGNFEHTAAPKCEPPVLQFSQRLAEIKNCLQLFQQRRAAGDEFGADQVLCGLLSDLARLDQDALSGLSESSIGPDPKRANFVSAPMTEYKTRPSSAPIHVLVVNESNETNGDLLPLGTFHGCQLCSVNNHELALRAICAREPFHYVVCNASPMAFDELNLVRTIRADRKLDGTKIFMTSIAFNALEHLELANSYRIDGWLVRPLSPHDLWNHIVESEQIDA